MWFMQADLPHNVVRLMKMKVTLFGTFRYPYLRSACPYISYTEVQLWYNLRYIFILQCRVGLMAS